MTDKQPEALRAKLKTYEDLGDAVSDVQLLRMGYAAARLEIESLKAQLAERASRGQAPAQAAPAAVVGLSGRLSNELRSMIEGMSVSVDVSTDDATAGHRYFGTVTEVMDDVADKHGVTLLVQDAKPNFAAAPTTQQEAQGGAGGRRAACQCGGCVSCVGQASISVWTSLAWPADAAASSEYLAAHSPNTTVAVAAY